MRYYAASAGCGLGATAVAPKVVTQVPAGQQCPPGHWQSCSGGVCSCSEGMPTGLKVVLGISGVLVVGLISLGFYQAYKGVRPIYSTPHGMNVYL